MTPQEEQLLNSLIERVNQTQLEEKDPDAEALLNQKLGPNPDALYMLAQTVLVQNIALDQAKAQVGQLQQQVQQLQQHPQPAHATSFLGRLLGEHDPAPPRQYQRAPAPPYQPVPQYAPQQGVPYGQPQYGQPQYQQAQFVPVGGQPSFLRGAMQTAAGVAAGALAFEGVESILHGFGHGGYGPGYGMGGFGMEGRPEETIINNNYYDDQGRGSEHGEHHLQDQIQDQGGGYDPRDNNANDNLRGFDQNAGNDLVTNDQDARDFADASNLDNPAAFDDQNVDDGSGFDDSGSFDDGGGFDSGGDGS